MDNTAFRAAFPEFVSTVKYPDAMLDIWSATAELQIDQNRWGRMYTMGVYLYVAHNITLQSQSVKTSTAGGTPGQALGVQNSKRVGDVATTSDVTQTSVSGAGHWNLTLYGKQYMQYARMFGVGGVQL